MWCGVSTVNSDKGCMKKIKLKLLSLLFVLTLFTPSLPSFGQDDKGCKDCVKITQWKSCDAYCTGSICVKFTNSRDYKVVIHYSWKRADNDSTISGDIYLEPGETSPEMMLCPYKDKSFTWRYEAA